VSHKLFIRAEGLLRVSNFHIHEDQGERLTAAITEQLFYVKYNSAAMWNFKHHLMWEEAIAFPLNGLRRYQHKFTHEVSHTALQGKVKSLWDEEWKGTHNINVIPISSGSTANDNVTNFTNQGPLLTSFWVSMINSVTCAYRKDRKILKKSSISSG